jgi:riboflavin biosynthesis pyrimidine reductase
MLEGGEHINGSLLSAGLIDELNIITLPLADGPPTTPITFEISDHHTRKNASSLRPQNIKI